jgi:hypothetical protein
MYFLVMQVIVTLTMICCHVKVNMLWYDCIITNFIFKNSK